MKSMAIATVAWLVLLVLMVLNGGIRDSLYARPLGEGPAHAVSSLAGIVVILAVSCAMLRWTPVARSPRALWLVGGYWTLLTIAFEIVFFHYISGRSWQEIGADYNVMKGRLWVFVLLATLIGPRLMGNVT